jgi:hypothetical protein
MLPAAGGPKRLHIIIGTPDQENCPICRAHGQGNFEKIEGHPAPILVQELSFRETLRCPCPLCAHARREEVEG